MNTFLEYLAEHKQKQMREITEVNVKAEDPEKVILFGRHCDGPVHVCVLRKNGCKNAQMYTSSLYPPKPPLHLPLPTHGILLYHPKGPAGPIQ